MSNLHTPLDRHIDEQLDADNRLAMADVHRSKQQELSDGEKLLRIRKLLERDAYYAPGRVMDEIRKIVGARTYAQQTGQEGSPCQES